jgi:ribonuclease D
MSIHHHHGDLPSGVTFQDSIAVDTETMGLDPQRDRLCVVQCSADDGDAHIVQLDRETYRCPNLAAVLAEPSVTKIFHFARFDVAVLQKYLGVQTMPIYCTKIASKLVRTYTDRHGLKDLCKELLNVDISKQQQSSDWGAKELTDSQLSYAASDVLYLHDLKQKLDVMLEREERTHLAAAAFDFLPTRALLDLEGWPNEDIFAH